MRQQRALVLEYWAMLAAINPAPQAMQMKGSVSSCCWTILAAENAVSGETCSTYDSTLSWVR
jgi:hypothetical protein